MKAHRREHLCVNWADRCAISVKTKNDACKRIGVSGSRPEPPPVPTPEKETP